MTVQRPNCAIVDIGNRRPLDLIVSTRVSKVPPEWRDLARDGPGAASTARGQANTYIGGADVRNRTRKPAVMNNHSAYDRATATVSHTPKTATDRKIERFGSQIEPTPDGCWRWTGKLDARGYGVASLNGVSGAHRVVYSVLVGPIPEGHHVHHVCHNRVCVNPDHLMCLTPDQHRKQHTRELLNARLGGALIGRKV